MIILHNNNNNNIIIIKGLCINFDIIHYSISSSLLGLPKIYQSMVLDIGYMLVPWMSIVTPYTLCRYQCQGQSTSLLESLIFNVLESPAGQSLTTDAQSLKIRCLGLMMMKQPSNSLLILWRSH